MKWKIAIGLLGTIALVTGGLLYTLQSEYVANRLKIALITSLSEELGANVSIDSLEIDPLSWEVRLYRIQMEAPDLPPFFSLEKASIVLKPVQLLGGSVTIERIVLERPVISIEMIKDTLNLPKFSPSEEDGLSLIIEEIQLKDGSFRLSIPGLLFAETLDLSANVLRDEAGDFGFSLLTENGALDLPRAHERIERLLIEGNYNNTGFTLSQFHLATTSIQTEINAILDPEQSTKGSANIFLPMNVFGRALGIADVSGQSRAEIHFDGQIPSLGGTGKLSLSDVSFGPYRLGSPTFDLRLIQDRLEIEKALIPIGDGSAEISGTIFLKENLPVTLSVKANKVPFAELLEDIDIPGSWVLVDGYTEASLEGQLGGEFALYGKAKAWGKDFLILPHSFRNPSWQAPYLSVPDLFTDVLVSIFADRIEFSEGKGGRKNTELRYSGTIFYDGELDFSTYGTVDLSDFGLIDGLQYEGTGTYTNGRLIGFLWDPIFSADTTISSLAIESYLMGTASASVHYHWPNLAFPVVAGQYKETAYQIENGNIDFSKNDYPIVAALQIQKGNAKELSEMLLVEEYVPAEIQSGLQGSFQVKGPIEAPDINGTLLLDQISVFGEKFSHAKIDLSYQIYGDLGIREAVFYEKTHPVFLAGDISSEGEFSLSLTSGLLHSTDLDLFNLKRFGFQTKYSYQIEAKGTLETPTAQATLILSDTSVAQFSFLPSRIELLLENNLLSFQGNLFQNDTSNTTASTLSNGKIQVGSFNGKFFGEVRLEDGFPFSVEIETDTLSLDRFLPDWNDATIETRSNVSLSGDLASPDKIQGTLLLPDVLASYGTESFSTRGPVEITLKDEVLSLQNTRFVEQSGAIAFNLAGVYPLGGDLTLDIATALDLNMLSTRLPASIESFTGTASAKGRVSVGESGVRFLGSAHLKETFLSFEGVPHPLEELEILLSLTENSILIDRLTGNFAGGDILAKGEIELRDFYPSSFQIESEIKGTEIRLPEEGIAASLDAALLLSGVVDDLLLSGDIFINRLQYDKNVEIVPSLADLVSGRARPTLPDIQDEDSSESLVRLDVEIHSEEPMKIENNVLNAELKIDSNVRAFRVFGSSSSPEVSGSIVLLRDDKNPPKLALRGVDFALTRSVLDFDGSFVDPTLDVVAETQIRDFEITLRIAGTALAPELLLLSSPPLPEEDIILLLTLGVTQREFEAGQILSIAPEILSQFTGVDKEIERILPKNVDINVITGFSEIQNTVVPKLQLKWEPFERLQVRGVSNVLSLTEENQIEFQLLLRDHLSLSGVWEQQGNTSFQGFSVGDLGLDLKRRWEF